MLISIFIKKYVFIYGTFVAYMIFKNELTELVTGVMFQQYSHKK